MLEDNRSRRILVNPQGNGQKERRQADDADEGTDDIEDAFNSPVVPEGQIVAKAEGDDMTVYEAFRIERCQGQAAQYRG